MIPPYHMDNSAHADKQLAQELINRLNKLLEDDTEGTFRTWLTNFLDFRLSAPEAVQDHPTVQCIDGQIGFLGMLNGIVGVQLSGPKKDWGYIAASFDDDTGALLNFVRVDSDAVSVE